MFEKETASLRYLVAFFTPNAMFFNNVINVINNVLSADGAYHHIVAGAKRKRISSSVITDSAGRIMFGSKHIEKL
jgi:hypothetical protein